MRLKLLIIGKDLQLFLSETRGFSFEIFITNTILCGRRHINLNNQTLNILLF